MTNLIKLESVNIIPFIYLIRKEKVMLDSDLAKLYGVETKRLKEAVRRNISRFPKDFMFELTLEEYRSLRTQFATLEKFPDNPELVSKKGKHSKFVPMVFTEQGVAMLSSVLNSQRAIRVNIAIMRAFVQIRHIALTNKDLQRKINKLEESVNAKFNHYDDKIKLIFEAIKQLIKTETKPKNPLGFQAKNK